MSTAVHEGTRRPARARAARLPPLPAVLVALGLALAGAAVDGGAVRALHGRAAGFVLGCALAAAVVRRAGLRALAVAPPLVYAAVALLTGLARGAVVPRTVPRQALALLTELVIGAPVLIAGTLAALLVVLVRLATTPGASARVGQPGRP